jgi:hypothetical protein
VVVTGTRTGCDDAPAVVVVVVIIAHVVGIVTVVVRVAGDTCWSVGFWTEWGGWVRCGCVEFGREREKTYGSVIGLEDGDV